MSGSELLAFRFRAYEEMASRSRISDFMHKAMPKWALGEGDVDGSRPVILNETIAKQYGMGSPTTFLTLEYGK